MVTTTGKGANPTHRCKQNISTLCSLLCFILQLCHAYLIFPVKTVRVAASHANHQWKSPATRNDAESTTGETWSCLDHWQKNVGIAEGTSVMIKSARVVTDNMGSRKTYFFIINPLYPCFDTKQPLSHGLKTLFRGLRKFHFQLSLKLNLRFPKKGESVRTSFKFPINFPLFPLFPNFSHVLFLTLKRCMVWWPKFHHLQPSLFKPQTRYTLRSWKSIFLSRRRSFILAIAWTKDESMWISSKDTKIPSIGNLWDSSQLQHQLPSNCNHNIFFRKAALTDRPPVWDWYRLLSSPCYP